MRYIRLSAMLLLTACGDGGTTPTTPPTPPTPPTPVATSITLSATSLSFASLGETSQLSATVKDQNGATMSGASVTWSSSSTSVATVSSSGLVTAVANGATTITATSGSASANANASIQQVAVSITLSPDSLVFAAAGDTATVTAIVLDAGGSDIASPSLTWSSSDETTVTVSSNGLVTAVASGPTPATVTAEIDDQQAEISARVKLSYMDVAVTGDGDPLPDMSVWLTDPSGENTKQVTDSVGKTLFRNLQPGEHTVTLQGTPAALTLTPTSPQTIQVAEDQQHDLVFTGAFPPAQITGTAKSWGKPVEGAVVRVEGKDTVQVTVNSAGVFQVDSVLRGEYTLTISSYTGVSFKETTLTQTLESGSNTPEFVGRPEIEPAWASVGGGGDHTCGVTTTGEAYCWGGNNDYGQLGDGTTTQSTTPTLVSGGHTWASVDGGWWHSCGVTTESAMYCWGYNTHGQRGDGTTTQSTTPTLVSGGHTWASVTGGGRHTCGVMTTGEAYCWGDNRDGLLGGSSLSSGIPVSGNHAWTSVTGGGKHTCGVTTTGEAYCWGGKYDYGQLGNGTTTQSATPTLVSGGHTWASVSNGDYNTCGVTTTGEAYCWGDNRAGRLGDGTNIHRSVPTLVSGGITTWTSVGGGGSSCGVTTFGEAYCWGTNTHGELGNGTTTNLSNPVPTLVSGGHTWTSVDTGWDKSCGVTTEGEAYCWGSNTRGHLGNGTTTDSSVPVKVGGNW